LIEIKIRIPYICYTSNYIVKKNTFTIQKAARANVRNSSFWDTFDPKSLLLPADGAYMFQLTIV